ncbi:hypothetical protein CLAFUW4_06748 [Fulvia fulva]|uniref:Uncharacterized protein n=1 Tax=Passalora fulva TaxID=5499 RepID=A0A9Q8PAT9_PASFU|nr:uncharacterized protein CLAFUR5_06885 [Fulvia fulva]KAK4621233.1 hypothetical protein CLAFUR4_06756 [Fulvia fulva]KAK4622486.1 hypothetical protein CLAFUR0_06751 [Fulvia fulva]UJO19070.1 hypothetical protein CLAFUR5_06885 [Fulvia fulva]WPV16403.1 hypothetical protein CLAFUW4_06748 [Fulvia fulva]WPV30919.1 hypothetical protein CLAFUW7_06747 [Fulvia fulva]
MATTAPNTLLGLASELRLAIFEQVFRSITIDIERGEQRVERTVTTLDREDDEDGPQISIAESAKRGLSPLPSTPHSVINLKLVNRTFAKEIGDKWHQQVTYHFPSTVAFIDVLSQWPKEKISSLRHVHVCDTPLPLYPIDQPGCYHTHDFSAAPPLFPGLALDTLTVENIWLEPNGKPLDGWCLSATYHALMDLVDTSGWRHFHYQSGILGLKPNQLRDIENKIAELKAERGEDDFTYSFRPLRPQLEGLDTLSVDGTITSSDTEEERAQISEWYAEHPEVEPQGAFPSDVVEKGIAFRASRGSRAKYIETGERLGPVLKGLMEVMTWSQSRATDEYLVDDGLDNATGHL